MAQPIIHFDCRKVLLLSVFLFLFVSVCFSSFLEPQFESKRLSSTSTSTSSNAASTRRLLESEKEEQEKKPLKKKTTTQSTKNQTKLIKPNSTLSSKNQTKTIKSDNISTKNQTKTIKSDNISTKNQTKTIKSNTIIPSKNQTKTAKSDNLSSKNQTKLTNSSSKTTSSSTDTGLKKKLNSTASITPSKIKKLNSTSSKASSKPGSPSTSSKKTLDLTKSSSNKTTKSTAPQNKTTKVINHETIEAEKKPIKKAQKASTNQQEKPKKQAPPIWFIEEEDDDLVSEFRDLPNKFHQTLIPDLERISTTSKAYITKANNEITKGFKPYVGKKYASTVAAVISCAFILIPLLLVSLLCNRIKAYFSLQKILIFIQVYLSIYFTILCVSSLVTGIEPLKFLYSTSRSTYVCLQVLQTLAYVFYLLLLLMFLVLVFSTESGLGTKFLGLAQTFVGFAVGLHYYVTVFHRVVLRQPPKTNWKIHGIYATCFLLICVFARADRRKKVYVEDGGGEGKQN